MTCQISTLHSRRRLVSQIWYRSALTDYTQQMPDGQRASRTYRLPGNTSVEYAFDDPSLQGKSIAVWAQSRPQYPKEVGIMEIGPQKPFVIPVCITSVQPKLRTDEFSRAQKGVTLWRLTLLHRSTLKRSLSPLMISIVTHTRKLVKRTMWPLVSFKGRRPPSAPTLSL